LVRRPNLARERYIPHQRPHDVLHDAEYSSEHKPQKHPKVHRSVKMRRAATDAKGRPYANRAQFADPEWVD
jgi:hypothetical protein